MKEPRIIQRVFEKVFPLLFEVMIDQQGRFLFMRLIGSCNEYQLQLIVKGLTLTANRDSFLSTSTNKYGSYSIRKLIEILKKPPLIDQMVEVLMVEFYRLMTVETGSNVILNSLNVLDQKNKDKLYQAAIHYALDLARDQKGFIFLNRFITIIEGFHRDQLLGLISGNAVWLAQEPSGAFVLQQVLKLNNPVYTEKICYLLEGHYVDISMQKASSYVVEKCLNSSGMVYVIEDFLRSDQLLRVCRHKYGKYVIQCALKATKAASSPLHQKLINKLQGYHESLQFKDGKHVFNLIAGGS